MVAICYGQESHVAQVADTGTAQVLVFAIFRITSPVFSSSVAVEIARGVVITVAKGYVFADAASQARRAGLLGPVVSRSSPSVGAEGTAVGDDHAAG